MTLDYISDRITRNEFLEKIYSKSGSDSAMETAKAHLSNLDYFCQDKYNRETITVLADLREDMERTRSPTKVLRFLDEFVKWLLMDHPNILLTKGVHNSAKYPLKRKHKNSVSVYFTTVRIFTQWV